jgi:beta-fructofuranosidase
MKTAGSAISAAMRTLTEAVPTAQSDPQRPIYHFTAPARWMNDINGPLYHRGYYHVFYQHNPFGDKPYDETVTDHIKWAPKYWGHARSRDLVSWEHLPIALAPATENGEKSCWSGCVTINGTGTPMLFYTAVYETELPYEIPFAQCAAVGNEEMILWERSPANPILAHQEHGRTFNPDWRDPFIFEADSRTFMIVGACGEAGTPIYEVRNPEFTQWVYKGIMWNRSVECPNFFPLEDKWVFISSPFDKVSYDVGSFDIESLIFSPETHGVVEYGHYYGTNILFDNQGRCILLGWIPGWDWDAIRSGCGWNGCMSLPRVLGLGTNRRLRQNPVPELETLRIQDTYVREADITVADTSHVLQDIRGDTVEIIAEFVPGSAASYGVKLRRSEDGTSSVTIRYDRERGTMDIAGSQFAIPVEDRETLKLQIFVDKCVIEVFVNDGEAVATTMLYREENDLGVEVFAHGGNSRIRSIDAWQMSPAAFQFSDYG